MALALRAVPSAGYDAQVISVMPFANYNGRVDWSWANGKIAVDKLESDGWYGIYTVNPDGSDERCLTRDCPLGAHKHKGNPAWHPSGKYVVFQGQNDFRVPVGQKIWDYLANPGIGVNCDLWLSDASGSKFWLLHRVPERIGGVLHPHFSYKGDRLLWAERIARTPGKWGQWCLKVADFQVLNNEPSLTNVRTLQPGRQHIMYESHGWTADDRAIVFSGNLEPGQKESAGDIYTYDLATEKLTNLTQTPDEWDEHAQVSPSGKKIVWMSSKGYKLPDDPNRVQTDFWIMNVDGSNKKRLTFFNEPGHPEYQGRSYAIAADSSWNADGTCLCALVILDTQKGEARNFLIHFDSPQ